MPNLIAPDRFGRVWASTASSPVYRVSVLQGSARYKGALATQSRSGPSPCKFQCHPCGAAVVWTAVGGESANPPRDSSPAGAHLPMANQVASFLRLGALVVDGEVGLLASGQSNPASQPITRGRAQWIAGLRADDLP